MTHKHKSNLQMLIGPDLSAVLQEATYILAQEIVSQEPPSKLVAAQQKTTQLERETYQAFEKLGEVYGESAHNLIQTLKLLSRTSHEIDYEGVVNELKEFGKGIDRTRFEELARIARVGDLRSQPVLNISENTLRALYESAAHIMAENRFEDAMKAFSVICTIEPNNYSCWVGYGHSAFHSHNYDAAILAYYMATSLNPSTPWPILWAANVCEYKKEYEAARDLLKRAQEVAGESVNKGMKDLIRDIDARLIYLPKIGT